MSDVRHEASCRCGAQRLTATGSPLLTFACHCSGCRAMSASAFSLSSLYPAAQVDRGTPETIRGGLKTGPDHRFCAECMTWLYTVPEGMADFVNIRSNLFATASQHRPFCDMWLDEGLGWADSGAERHYGTVPADEEFGSLVEAYAGWDGRVKE